MPQSTDITGITQYIGPGFIYYDCQVPAADVPQGFVAPATHAVETGIPLAVGGSGAATYIGATNGPTEVDYTPTWKAVEIEQTTAEVGARVMKEAVTAKFKAAIGDWTTLQRALQAATLVTTTSGTSAPDKKTLHIGGLTFAQPVCVCIVSPIGTYTGTDTYLHAKYEWVTIYQRLAVNGFKHIYKNRESRMIDVVFTGYGDPTRPEHDQLFQIGQDITPR